MLVIWGFLNAIFLHGHSSSSKRCCLNLQDQTGKANRSLIINGLLAPPSDNISLSSIIQEGRYHGNFSPRSVIICTVCMLYTCRS